MFGYDRQRILPAAAICLTAALAFWLPSVVIHFSLGDHFGAAGVVLTTIACPAVVVAVLAALCLLERDISPARYARWFLLGVWLWGPPCMFVSATFSGGGQHTLSDLGGLLLVWALFPVSTPMMATYDGSLVALLATTVMLLVTMIVSGAEQGILRER